MAETGIPTSAAPVRLETMVERQRRRARLVLALRLAVLVFLVGGWELGVRVRPDRSVLLRPAQRHRRQADRLVSERHLDRPAVEADLGDDRGGRRGLPDRRGHGHPLRHRAWAQPAPVRRVLDLHQGGEFDPARGAGLDLHHRAWPWARPPSRAGGRDGVLRRVRQRLPGRARGRQEPDRQRAHPRRQRLADDARGR